jgi:hypothetical protein
MFGTFQMFQITNQLTNIMYVGLGIIALLAVIWILRFMQDVADGRIRFCAECQICGGHWTCDSFRGHGNNSFGRYCLTCDQKQEVTIKILRKGF